MEVAAGVGPSQAHIGVLGRGPRGECQWLWGVLGNPLWPRSLEPVFGVGAPSGDGRVVLSRRGKD